MRLARSSKFLLHIELITNSSVDEDPVPVKKRSNIMNMLLYLYFSHSAPLSLLLSLLTHLWSLSVACHHPLAGADGGSVGHFDSNLVLRRYCSPVVVDCP